MKKLLILLVCQLTFVVEAQKIDIQEVEKQLQELPNHTEIAIAVIENGETKFYGFKKENDTLKNIANQHSLFEIGSITKVFTSTLLASLEVEKKISSEQTIDKILKIKLLNKPKISLLQLANHTSGLPRLPSNLLTSKLDPTHPYKNYDEEELNFYLKKQLQLNSQPGEKSNYSNLGAGILAHALCKHQKESFDKLLKKYIFTPFNMKESFSAIDKATKALVPSYTDKNQVISNWEWDVLAGAGSMISSSHDLSLFLLESLSGKHENLNRTHQATFTENEHITLGMGWHISTNSFGEEIRWHNGATAGYMSFISFDSKAKTGVVILSNIAPDYAPSETFNVISFGLIE